MNTKDSKHIFHGAITDVQMWNRSLSVSEIEGWTDCGDVPPGDLINWQTVDLNNTGLTLQTVERDEICGTKQNKGIIAAFNRKLNFFESINFCSNLGEVTSGVEERDQEVMMEALEVLEEPVCTTSVLSTGIMFSEERKSWTDYNTGSAVSVDNWFQGRPSNNTEINNCLYLLSFQRQFYDLSCVDYAETCPICRVTKV